MSDPVLNVRVTNLEKVVERVSDAVKSIAESLQMLTRLDVQHDESRSGLGRAFVAIEDHEKRMRSMESEMPTLKLVRGWAIGGMATFAGAFGLAIIALVLK